MYYDIGDKIPYLYLQMGRLRIWGRSLQFINKEESLTIPIGQYSALFIGPGVSLTDRAIKYSASMGTLLLFVGEDVSRCYAILPAFNKNSEVFLKQIDLYRTKKKQLLKKYFKLRFNKTLIGWRGLSEEKLRGLESSYMKKIYIESAKKYGIHWIGRMKEDQWENNTIYNKGISICNSFLYGMASAVLNALGYSPALGLLHTGNTLSLSFDIADIYKSEFSIPLGFEIAREASKNKELNVDKEIRRKALSKIKDEKLISKMVADIKYIYDDNNNR